MIPIWHQRHRFFFLSRKSRGTVTAPTIIVAGDDVGGIQGQGYDGSTYITGAGIMFNAGATVGSGSVPQTMRFYTGGVIAAGQERMRITTAGRILIGTTTEGTNILEVNGSIGISDANNLVLGTTTGNKIGTATTQKIGFWNAAPIVQPTTATASATFVANAGTAINTLSTFDGYKIDQVVKALRNAGILA